MDMLLFRSDARSLCFNTEMIPSSNFWEVGSGQHNSRKYVASYWMVGAYSDRGFVHMFETSDHIPRFAHISFTQGMGAIGRDHMKPQLHGDGGQLEFLHLSTETHETQSMKFHRRFHCKRGFGKGK